MNSVILPHYLKMAYKLTRDQDRRIGIWGFFEHSPWVPQNCDYKLIANTPALNRTKLKNPYLLTLLRCIVSDTAHHYGKLNDSKNVSFKVTTSRQRILLFSLKLQKLSSYVGYPLCTAKTLNLCTMHEVKSFQKKTHKFDTGVRVLNDGHLQNLSLEMH